MKLRNEDHIEKIDDISNYKPIHNKVVVRQLTDNTVKRIGTTKIIFPTHVRIGKVAARNSVRYGEVVSAPKEYVSREGGKYQTRWDTEIEIVPGDVVWCEHTAFHKAEKFIEPDGDFYYIVDYQHLVVAKRDSEVIMLNGRVMLELEDDSAKLGSLFQPKKPTSICKVIYSGSSNSNYRFPGFEDPDIKAGDRVFIPPTKYFKLEDDIWAAFGGKYYYTQKHQIVGVIEGQAKEEEKEESVNNS